MKKYFLKISLLTLLAAFFACSDDTEAPRPEPTYSTNGVYILHQGPWGKNDGMLSYYNTKDGTMTDNIFGKQNKDEHGIAQKLGDVAEDLLIYGSKMYITVTQSKKIFITDLTGKLQKGNSTIDLAVKEENENAKPRYIIPYKEHVYINLYSGELLKIDTTSYEIKGRLKIEKHTEQMTVVNNELYMSNTGEYPEMNNSISIIDLDNFKVKEVIEIYKNPVDIVSDQKAYVYLLANGDYDFNTDGFHPKLFRINTSSKKVEEIISTDAASNMTLYKEKLMLMNRTGSANTAATEYRYYDIYQQQLIEKPFITIPDEYKKELNLGYRISVDPVTANIYVFSNDYVTSNTMFVFDQNGTYITHKKTGGINAIGARFVTTKVSATN